MNNALEVKNLTVAYNGVPALSNIAFSIPYGVICAIVGPNGAGKTTLMKALLNLILPAAGSIELLNGTYSEKRDEIAYVPQRASVDWDFPVSVLDVVLMGRYRALGWFKRPRSSDRERALDALKKVKLDGYAERHISQLSGGERQRVFLARALVQDAQLYIMDEPFVGVDAVTEATIVDVLKLLRQQGKTIIVVHHDLQTLQEYFDWMILLNQKVIADGPLQQVFTKKNIETAYGSLPSFFALPG